MRDLSQLLSRALFAFSPLGRQRLSILIYHRVLKERDWMRPGEPTEEEFDWQMRLLRRHFTVLPLREAVQLLKKGCLPSRAVCVTFDDGYADNATVALPVLQRHGVPATVFVAAGYLNGGRMWNDTVIEFLRHYNGKELNLSPLGMSTYSTASKELRRHAANVIIKEFKYREMERREEVADYFVQRTTTPLPTDLMLTTDQLQRMHKLGMEIGGHTFSHPILSRLPLEQAQDEILRGKRELETLINAPLRLFAYPNGSPDVDYHQEHVTFVEQAGFEAAVATSWGVSSPRSDLFQLARFTPWDKSSIKFLLRMALNGRHVTEIPGENRC